MTILTNDDLDEIIRILDSSPYDNLRIRTSAFELTVKRSEAGWTQQHTSLGPVTVIGSSKLDAPQAKFADAADADVEGLISVRAPMVGTFYRAPKPGAEPFVDMGRPVEEHAVIGIIETMKLMNSIPAGAKGLVVEILVADGALVQAGQTLMRLKP